MDVGRLAYQQEQARSVGRGGRVSGWPSFSSLPLLFPSILMRLHKSIERLYEACLLERLELKICSACLSRVSTQHQFFFFQMTAYICRYIYFIYLSFFFYSMLLVLSVLCFSFGGVASVEQERRKVKKRKWKVGILSVHLSPIIPKVSRMVRFQLSF